MSRWKITDRQVRDSEVQLRVANAAVRESEQKYRSMVEIIPDWIWEIDQNSTYTYSSPKIKDLLGYAPEEVIGKSPFGLMPEAEAEHMKAIFHDIVISQKPIERLENTNIHKDGHLVVLETSCVPIYDDHGNFIGYRGIDRDITERKRVEMSLLESEKKFRDLIESAPVGITVTTPDGTILEANPAILKLLNCESKERFLEESILSCYCAPKDRQRFMAELEKGIVRDFEVKLKRSDGTTFWGSLTSIRQAAEDGTTHFVTIMQDIDERKQAEQQIEALSMFPGENPNPVLRITREGNLLYANDASSTILEEWGSVVGQTVPDKWRNYIREAFESKRQQNFEIEHQNKTLSFVITPVTEAGYANLYGRDITERVKSEKEREQLMSLLTEKTQQMESLLRIVTHDLRSPLVNIAGFSQELESDSKQIVNALDGIEMDEKIQKKLAVIANESIPDSLNFIISSTRKMEALIDSLSKLSKLGRMELIIEAVDMEALMEEIVTVNQFKTRELGATIEVETLPECLGDINQVNQVFANLVSNALKYLDPEKTGAIKITGRTEGSMSIYCVEDNGIGIPDNHKEKIFEIFHRVDAKSPVAGEGIGLTAVKQILGRLNGRVWVESDFGKGSRFFVSLPNIQSSAKS